MTTKTLTRALLFTALTVSVACSNPEAPSDDDGRGTTPNGHTVALTIDGTAFQPTTVDVVMVPANGPIPESLSIVASAPSSGSSASQVVSIMVPSRIGIYDVRSAVNMLVRLQRGAFGLEQWWEASGPLGNGTVEITSRTANAAEGRIIVSMAPSGTGAGAASKTCTGTFSVRF